MDRQSKPTTACELSRTTIWRPAATASRHLHLEPISLAAPWTSMLSPRTFKARRQFNLARKIGSFASRNGLAAILQTLRRRVVLVFELLPKIGTHRFRSAHHRFGRQVV